MGRYGIWSLLERLEVMGHMQPFFKAIIGSGANLKALRMIEVSAEHGANRIQPGTRSTYARFISSLCKLEDIYLSLHSRNMSVIPAICQHRQTLRSVTYLRHGRQDSMSPGRAWPLNAYEVCMLSSCPLIESLGLDIRRSEKLCKDEMCEDKVNSGFIL